MSHIEEDLRRKSPGEIAHQAGYDVGHKDGFELGLKAALDYLEYKYIEDPDRPDRGTPEGEAILAIAKQTGEYVRAVLSGEIKIGEKGA